MQLIEQLETRRLLASFTAASVADLIADINAANAAGGANTITLAAASTFKLNAVNNYSYGPNGLPIIASDQDLTIFGNGATIQRSNSDPAFRLFIVAPGGSLVLSDMTLSGGFVPDNSFTREAQGGGIFSQGTLSLNRVTVQNCIAQGQSGANASGGGIYSIGVLTIANSVIQNNQALAGAGTLDFYTQGRRAEGGGLYTAGTAALTNTTLSSNLAKGGDYTSGAKKLGATMGGDGLGGAIYAAGALQISGSTITKNAATGGSSRSGYSKGIGQGGGLYIASGASVSLDAFTQAHTSGNSASTSDNDIFGSFTLLG